jgi:hypothetical protein
MQFRVPQFIDIEDKIFGPFTFKQFVYLAGGAGISYILWRVLPTFLAILVIVPVIALSLALTFYKVNDRPFIDTLQAGVNFLFKNKLYLWKKGKAKTKPKAAPEKPKEEEKPLAPKLTASKLKDLAWSLDVLDIKQK